MCGICGEIRLPNGAPPDPSHMQSMADALDHRGPDGEGLWRKDNVVLGHRRLKIMDVGATAHQPMVDDKSGVAITYNGEIYNFVELRDQLRDRGHRFTSTGDTEVLLRGYLEWGEEVVDRINGMFAFVVVDRRRGKAFMARDPMGQKPLFYYKWEHGLIFASELTALQRHPLVPCRLDRNALAHYLVFDGFPAPLTPIEDVRKLEPGFVLSFGLVDGEINQRRFWKLVDRKAPDTGAPPEKADFSEFEQHLKAAVNRHLRSDVPLGIFLSGGLDSTAITLLATDILGPDAVETFTLSVRESSFDEGALARETADILGTRNHTITFDEEDFLERIPGILDHMDEPIADPGHIASCCVSEFAVQHVKVALTGDGGDEFLFGYPPFTKWSLGEAFDRLPRWVGAGIVKPLVGLLPAQYGYMGLFHRARVFSNGLGREQDLRNTAWLSSFLPEEIPEVLLGAADLPALRPADFEGTPMVYDQVIEARQSANNHDSLAKLSYEFQTTFLPISVCAHTDKASMMHSLEARAPFLDMESMRYFEGLPSSWKVRHGNGKWFLREYLRGRLGDSVVDRPKKGFSVPVALWLRDELKGLAEKVLDIDRLAAEGVFDASAVTRLWQDHQTGRRNNYKKLWNLIVFQNWLSGQPDELLS